MSSRALDGVRWILFDAVGTLIYPDPPVAEAYYQVARDFQSQLTVAAIKQRFAVALASEEMVHPSFDPQPKVQAFSGHVVACGSGSSDLHRQPTSEARERDRWRRVVAAVLSDVPDAAGEPFERLWRHFAEPSSWRLYGDVTAALSALAARGYRLGIASNFDSRLLKIIGAHDPLAACEQVFVSSEIGFSKPDSRFFGAVEARLGGAGREILLVGDDYRNDLEGAVAAGWQSVLVTREGDAKSPGVLRSLAELLA